MNIGTNIEQFFQKELGKDPIIFSKDILKVKDTTDYRIIGELGEAYSCQITDHKNKIIYQYNNPEQNTSDKFNEVFVDNISEVIKEYNELDNNESKINFVYTYLIILGYNELTENSIDKFFEEFIRIVDPEILNDAAFSVIEVERSCGILNDKSKILGTFSTNYVGLLTKMYSPIYEYIYNKLKNIMGFNYNYSETIRFKNK